MELSRINLNLLLSLYHLLNERSVTRAASTQHITQPAMSRNLSQLREIFNDPLLVRVGNDMHLTPRAESLWQQLPDLLNQLESLFVPGDFEPAGYQGQFNIAATDYITQELLPPVLAQLQLDAPGLDLHFHLWHPGMMDSLRQGRLDLATCLLDQIPDDIYGRCIATDNYSCLVSAEGPLAEGELTIQRYIDSGHIAVTGGGDKIRAVDDALNQLGLYRQLKLTVPFIHSALAITARSHYLLTLPDYIARQLGPGYGLVSKSLPAELQITAAQYYLIWHHRLQNDPAHRYLRERIFQALSHDHPV